MVLNDSTGRPASGQIRKRLSGRKQEIREKKVNSDECAGFSDRKKRFRIRCRCEKKEQGGRFPNG